MSFSKRALNIYWTNRPVRTSCRWDTNVKRFSTKPSQKKSYLHVVGDEPLRYMTIGRAAEEAANRWPNRQSIISADENISVTFSDLLQEANKLAAGMLEIGIKRGDMVGLWAPNLSKWIIIKIAACRIGLRLVAINPANQASEIEYCLNKVGIKALFCMDEHKMQNFHGILQKIVPNLGKDDSKMIDCDRVPSLKTIIIISKQKYPGTYSYETVLSAANPTTLNDISQMQHVIQPDEGCNIQFTSGTTGNPKAAELSHMSIINNGYSIGKRLGLNQQHDMICLQVPLFHVFGVVVGFSAALQHGATLVLPSISYDAKKSLPAILKHRCSVIYGTPTMYVDLLNTKRTLGVEVPFSPRTALSGGAPCAPQLFRSMNKELNVQSIKSVFGMTEGTASSFFSRYDDDPELSANSVGYLQDHLEAKVINEKGETVDFGEVGELCIRGYSIMLGYWGDDAKTKEILGPDRWMKTGDQFRLLENGYGQIVGRTKDMIIRGGENIYPVEVENYLNTHPDILESQVLGIKDDRLGEVVCAAIRLKEDAKLREDDLKSFCKGKIAHYKIPTIIKIMDAFPKTGSGKIKKHEIRQIVENS